MARSRLLRPPNRLPTVEVRAIVINVQSLSEAEVFARDEPFFVAGLYETQAIHRMRKGYWNPEAAPRTAQDDQLRVRWLSCCAS